MGVGEDLLEGAVGELLQQLFAGGEMPVQRAEADPGVHGERRHGHPRAVAVHRGDRGPDQGFPVDQGGTARSPGSGTGGRDHQAIQLRSRW